MATPPSSLPLWRTTLIGVATLVAAALVAAATASLVLTSTAPALAVQLGPWNAEAKGKLAAWLLLADDPGATAKAWSMARTAILRSPGNANALATFGALATARGYNGLADSTMHYAERLSRHNRVAELYLIERAVQGGDVPAVLLHYDHALSTSREIMPVLLPVLSAAAAEPPVLAALVERLKRRPIWSVEFARFFVGHGRDPARTLPALLPVLALNPADEAQRVILSAAMGRLIDAGAYSAAVTTFDRTFGVRRLSHPVWNGDFSRRAAVAPIDWSLHDEPGLSGVVQEREGAGVSDNALFVMADSEHSGEVARQLLLLSPGSYRLTALAGDVDAASPPSITVVCVGKSGASLAVAAVPVAPVGGRRIAAGLRVPTNCPAQWLIVGVTPADARSDTPAWIDNIAITPDRRAP